jgi:hypothetical protein
LKISSATSATATGPRPQAGQSSDRQLSPISAEFALGGPSNPPDPATHAYRKDLADIALASRVIASHYAQPLAKILASATTLRARASGDSEAVRELEAGERFDMLDNSLGWAWGYAGNDRLVGYVPSNSLR